MSSFTSNEINSLLITESGRIGPEIYRKTINQSPWLNLVRQAAWPDGMGTTISALTWERSLPTNNLTWSTLGYNPAGDATSPQTGGTDEGNCLPPKQTINFAQTLRTYNLAQTALESPKLCLNDLRFPWQVKEQLGAIMDILAENVKYAWESRYRNEYFRLCGHKVVAKAGLPENTTTNVDPNSNTVTASLFPNQAATTQLTASILQRYAGKMIRDGAGMKSLSKNQGQPVFGLICSPEVSERLILDNSDIRQDYRWIDGQAKELLAPLGVDRSYKNFFHILDWQSPRYDWINGSGYIRRPFYASTAASYGNKSDINPDYETAAYEVSFIFHQDVMESMIPKPISAPGGNTKFNPQKYRGDFNWLNILNKDDNPDGTIGFFRSVFQNGSKSIRPEWGYAILHQRCPQDYSLNACAAT